MATTSVHREIAQNEGAPPVTYIDATLHFVD
jgi:hypothetical protein